MSEYLIQGDTLTAIADAIRGKTGDTATMTAADMAGLIEGIEVGGEYEMTDGIITMDGSYMLNIDVGLSDTPDFFVMIRQGVIDQNDTIVSTYKMVVYSRADNADYAILYSTFSSSSNGITRTLTIPAITWNGGSITIPQSGPPPTSWNGDYRWFAAKKKV